jgi:hypothetical protein
VNLTTPLAALLVLMAGYPAGAEELIAYGSRAGMENTVLSKSGIDTANAVIRTVHTWQNAINFCEQYVDPDNGASPECVQSTLAAQGENKLSILHANCVTGDFIGFGEPLHFLGKRDDLKGSAKLSFVPPYDRLPYYLISDDKGVVKDQASSSGYGVDIDIYRALCPSSVSD